MLSKSKASPCIVTLILSFVLSSYSNNLLRIKLKTCIINCFGRCLFGKFLRNFLAFVLFAKLVA